MYSKLKGMLTSAGVPLHGPAFVKDGASQPAAGKKGKAPVSRARLALRIVGLLGAAVVGFALLVVFFGGAILNGYFKHRVERAFDQAHPGSVLRIGRLTYSMTDNRMAARSVRFSRSSATLDVERISLLGVRWSQLLWKRPAFADVLVLATLDATNLDMKFPDAHYDLRCARLRISGAESGLTAQRMDLRALAGDDAFFAAQGFRTIRFHVVAPECKVAGLAYKDFLDGKSYQARSLQFSGVTVDALVDRDKPLRPFVKEPLMVRDALAAIGQPLQVDNLDVTNGALTYSERESAGAAPAVLTFSDVSLSAKDIANHGAGAAAIQVRAEGKLMDAGVLKVSMSLPINSPGLALQCSGSLGPMDLTRLNPFLETAKRLRITSGEARATAFDIDVSAGQARGSVRGNYSNLAISILDKGTGTRQNIDDWMTSLLVNDFRIRASNSPNARGELREGRVNHTKKPSEQFLQFLWLALWSGIKDTIAR